MGEAGSTTAATLAIWPTSTLTGTYVLPKDKGDGPKSLSIRLAQPPSSSRVEFPEGSVGCQLDANRGWSCEVPAPAVPIDIAIHAAGFVPVYMWGVAVTGGSRKAMGPIALGFAGGWQAWWPLRRQGVGVALLMAMMLALALYALVGVMGPLFGATNVA